MRRHEPFGTRESVDGLGLPLTQIQRNLIARLPNYSDKAAKAYLGALCAYYDSDYPDRASHFAYSLRDVTDHLARESQDPDEVGKGLKPGRRRQLLLKTIDPSTNQSYGRDAEYDLLSKSYSVLSKIAHPRKFSSSSKLAGHLTEVENALHELIVPQIVINKVIDKIISEPSSEINMNRLIGLMINGATQLYVIKNMPPEWLHDAAKAEFFTQPKSKKHWLAHLYLYKCVDHDPDKVTEVILSYKPGMIRDDPSIFGEFLRCADKLSAPYVARISKFILDENLHDLFVYYPREYLAAATKLYLDGRYDLAVDFASRGLSIDNINYDRYPGGDWLNIPIGDFVNVLMEEDLLPLFGLLADLLERIIMGKAGTDGIVHGADSSMCVMRPSIEDSDQNLSDDLERSLVTHMRNCLVHIGRGDPDHLRAAVEITRKKSLLIYRRLEMFAYYTFPDPFRAEMEEYAVRYLGQLTVYHEHYLMLEQHFTSMSESTKKSIVTKIMEYEVPERLRDDWLLRSLECIKGGLDGEPLVVYQRLAGERGPVSHPGYLMWRGSGDIEPARTPGPLEGKSAEDAFKIMAKHVPDARSDDEILDGFSCLVRAQPTESSRLAMRLADADPRVQMVFFRRLDDAVSDKKEIAWGPVLSLMRRVLDDLPGAADMLAPKMTVLMSHVLRDAFFNIPPGAEFKDDLWEVVRSMARPESKDEDEWDVLERKMDSITKSINSHDGLSFHVLILYARWLCDVSGEEALAPEVRHILDEYARNPVTHTVSRHSVIGAYFPWLHSVELKWALEMIQEFKTSRMSKIAFWDGYIGTSRLYENVFSDLYDWYEPMLNKSISNEIKWSTMYKRTFAHALLAYLYCLKDSERIFDVFLYSLDEKKSPKDLVDYCVFEIGIVAREIQKNSGFDVERFKVLWTHPVFSKQNLSDWFVGGKVDKKTKISLYLEYVREYRGKFNLLDGTIGELKTLADEFPPEVANCILCLVSRPLNEYIPDDIHDVLRILEKHKEVADILKKIRERMAQRSG